MGDAFKSWLSSLVVSALEGFDNSVGEAAEVLTGGLSLGIWNDCLDLSENLLPFCYTIVAICLLTELTKATLNTQMWKVETVIMVVTKMVIAKVCIEMSPTFLYACYLQSQDWIISIANSSVIGLGSAANSEVTRLVNQVSGFGQAMGLFLSTSIVLMAIKICGMMVYVIALGRMFELMVYLVVSPLPCAFMPLSDGGSSVSRITSKFFKSFIAVCLQGVMMVIVIQLFGIILENQLTDAIYAAGQLDDANMAITDLIYTMLMGSIALVMAVMKSGSWAKQIIDAM